MTLAAKDFEIWFDHSVEFGSDLLERAMAGNLLKIPAVLVARSMQ